MLLLVVTALGSILFQQFIQLAHSINLIEGLSIIVASLLVALSNIYLGYTKMERNSEIEEKLKDCKKNSLLRDKKFVERHPEEIKVGDILQLMPGTTIPADRIVIKGKELSVDESAGLALKKIILPMTIKFPKVISTTISMHPLCLQVRVYSTRVYISVSCIKIKSKSMIGLKLII